MEKYHITDTGPKLCTASIRECPYHEHFDLMEKAVDAYEKGLSKRYKNVTIGLSKQNDFGAFVVPNKSTRLTDLDTLNGSLSLDGFSTSPANIISKGRTKPVLYIENNLDKNSANEKLQKIANNWNTEGILQISNLGVPKAKNAIGLY